MATKKKSASKSKKAPVVEASQDAAEPVEANAEQAPATSAGPTLQDAADSYLKFLDADGAGFGTVSSYTAEIRLALRELGESTLLADLTSERVAEYYASPAVMRTKSGRPKAKASYMKTQRVIRLCLMHAQDEGLVEVAPIPAGATKRATLKAV